MPSMYSVKPIGWKSSPHFLTDRVLEKVTNELIATEAIKNG